MKKQRGKIESKKGSITVEAVFFVPLIMAVLLLFLWLTLYLHDRVAARGALQQAVSSSGDYLVYGTLPESGYLPKAGMVERGSLYAVAGSSPAKEKRLEDYFKMLLSGQLFLYQLEDVSIQKKGCYLILKADFSCNGFALMSLLMPEQSFAIIYEEKCFWAVREEITRIGSVLFDFFEEADWGEE